MSEELDNKDNKIEEVDRLTLILLSERAEAAIRNIRLAELQAKDIEQAFKEFREAVWKKYNLNITSDAINPNTGEITRNTKE